MNNKEITIQIENESIMEVLKLRINALNNVFKKFPELEKEISDNNIILIIGGPNKEFTAKAFLPIPEDSNKYIILYENFFRSTKNERAITIKHELVHLTQELKYDNNLDTSDLKEYYSQTHEYEAVYLSYKYFFERSFWYMPYERIQEALDIMTAYETKNIEGDDQEAVTKLEQFHEDVTTEKYRLISSYLQRMEEI